MEQRPLRKQTLVEQAIERMEQLIQSESWPLGSRIPPEPELVQAFGVSRNSIREALKSLIHVGVLEARQGDGTYVCSKSSLNALLFHQLKKADERETAEVRFCLEREIARLAAERRTESDIEEMRKWLRLSGEAHRMGDDSAHVQHDYRFHLALATATHNRLLVSLYESIAGAVQQSVCASVMRSETRSAEMTLIHEQLIDAIEEQDVNEAELLVRRSLQLAYR
ncbi:FadR/GntR family transcriptional regulator [Paenibacillus apiarius]|uniref:FadR family transcriptional regulator n=1 Tax=Paenibacillus apiarius TaxID=46240 RepID=A0ABT4DZU6_9BACL|nr:FadR/GntR family transcriptional regulator [Paenibacillus apiarius]MBN3524422.1 FadR family transcriptional regulator [Paenibacillus apiarius]MCY9516602.1 FadR family transcriptional regulator [Paenibacillus apiarius]MCY9522861.1 FadR family transcriptional regulator [Paenibacillus apiarius]MCY9550565.1 FadR family transcriptional regulator [Paenibacillus apiarius]MCY9560790.1 FadR family transcriptional regulator [Paenibacillus apiarius]